MLQFERVGRRTVFQHDESLSNGNGCTVDISHPTIALPAGPVWGLSGSTCDHESRRICYLFAVFSARVGASCYIVVLSTYIITEAGS